MTPKIIEYIVKISLILLVFGICAFSIISFGTLFSGRIKTELTHSPPLLKRTTKIKELHVYTAILPERDKYYFGDNGRFSAKEKALWEYDSVTFARVDFIIDLTKLKYTINDEDKSIEIILPPLTIEPVVDHNLSFDFKKKKLKRFSSFFSEGETIQTNSYRVFASKMIARKARTEYTEKAKESAINFFKSLFKSAGWKISKITFS